MYFNFDISRLLVILGALSALGVVLGLWKAVEIAVWLVNHVRFV